MADSPNPKTPNEKLQRASVARAIGAERLKASTVRKIRTLLQEVDDRLAAQIVRRIQRLGPVEQQLLGQGKFTTKRLIALRDALSVAERQSRQILYEGIVDTGVNFARAEGSLMRDSMTRVINGAVTVNFEAVAVSNRLLRKVVTSRPFEGKLLREHTKDWGRAKKAAIMREVRIGVVAGESTLAIAKRVRGTIATGGRGSALFRSRESAEALIRTAISHIMNATREEVFSANSDVTKGVQWSATLDTRTCVRCAALDGKVFPVNSGPRPPLHINCRCATVPVTSFSNIPGQRASMAGPVPDNLTMNEFMKEMLSAEQQDRILGSATKGRLFRSGGLDLDGFVDRTGRPFSLDELRRMHAEVFERLGL